MGQKVNPNGIRLGYIRDWNSTWYASSKDYADKLSSDLQVREFLKKKLVNASISKIKIERPANNAKVTICTARPGVVIGKKGEDIEKLRNELSKLTGVSVQVNVEEISRPEAEAQLVADGIAQQLEKRVMFRRAMKKAVQGAMKSGAKGIKVQVSGRIGGAEIARSETIREGRVPLHTFRADIQYGTAEALTTYGILGIKVWIYHGDILPGQIREVKPSKPARSNNNRRRRAS